MKKAFTLAEVLITLAIIGVVAALTIPSVITDYKRQEIVVQLKKTISTLSNITNSAIADHGQVQSWDFGANATNLNVSSEEFAKKYMIPYLRVVKECQAGDTSAMCRPEIKFLNSTTDRLPTNNYYFFQLSDGTYVGVLSVNNSSHGGNKGTTIIVDINGDKKPNTLGIDVFNFGHMALERGQVRNKFLYTGHDKTIKENITDSEDGCNKNSNGNRCITVIIQNGWKIPTKDEYVQMAGNEEYRALYPW
ncbi:MAG: type II secretion system protein [Cyanobacteria bacterium SIG30]|nr:type II secretion system protein [Cyanobacteria bacterium SIG30]